MEDTLFTKILNREIPADFVYEDNICFAIKDINPQTRVHLLLIPRKPIPTLFDLTEEDSSIMGHMVLLLPKLAKQFNLNGFKTQINTGATGGQEVFHIHFHLLGN